MSFLPDELSSKIATMRVGETSRSGECPWCGKGTRRSDFFVVAKHNTYTLLHCYKCHRTKRLNSSNIPLSVIRSMKESRSRDNSETEYILKSRIQLPVDFTNDLPIEAELWLRQYNISSEERSTYNIGYSPLLNRVILPVYSGDVLVYWQGRRLGALNGSPKYVNLRSKYHKREMFFIEQDSEMIVVVEDILSAIAVSRTGLSAVALLGTNLPYDARILEYENVIVWLDPDKKALSQQYAKRLRSLGKQSRAIVTHTKDPKEFTPEEINSYLRR